MACHDVLTGRQQERKRSTIKIKAKRSGFDFDDLVGLAQLAEHRIVVPGVVGSSPISHPTKNEPGKAGLIHNRKEIGM